MGKPNAVGAGLRPAPTIRRRRRRLRLKGYDYSQAGGYFVTICTHRRTCLFGDVDVDTVRLNEIGIIAQKTWSELPAHYPYVSLDAFVVMPNHLHGIIVLGDETDDSAIAIASFAAVGAGLRPAPTKSRPLSEIVRAFKSFSARAINRCRGSDGKPVWQRNYYEHIIRDERDLDRIREYIAGNPVCWAEDADNPAIWARRASHT